MIGHMCDDIVTPYLVSRGSECHLVLLHPCACTIMSTREVYWFGSENIQIVWRRTNMVLLNLIGGDLKTSAAAKIFPSHVNTQPISLTQQKYVPAPVCRWPHVVQWDQSAAPSREACCKVILCGMLGKAPLHGSSSTIAPALPRARPAACERSTVSCT